MLQKPYWATENRVVNVDGALSGDVSVAFSVQQGSLIGSFPFFVLE